MTHATSLVAALRCAHDGDAIATARLIAALYGPVRRAIAANVAGYPDDILEDATQEAMTCVYRRLAGCRAESDGALVRWAMVVGWHEALRYLRSPSAGLPTGYWAEQLDAQMTAVADVTTWLEMTTDRTDADGSNEAESLPDQPVAVLVRVVTDSYAALARCHTEVLWHRAVIGAPYRELATTYGTTTGAAKRRFQRAVAALRRSVLRRAANLPEPERTAVLGLIGAFTTAPNIAGRVQASDAAAQRRR